MKYDKIIHLLAGTIIYVLMLHFGVLAASISVVSIAYLKEYYDSKHPPHVYDGWDAYATVVGIPIGHIVYKILNLQGWWPIINVQGALNDMVRNFLS